MIPILERNDIPSLGQRFKKGMGTIASEGIPMAMQHMAAQKMEKDENETIRRLTGQDVSGLSPDIKKEFIKSFTGARAQKEQEKSQMMQLGLSTVGKMRELISATGPSNYLKGVFPGETARKRAEFEQLGRSLIPLVAAGVSIRNQREFDEYSKTITDPNAQQSKIEGALNGLQNLLERQINQEDEKEESAFKSIPKRAGKIKFNPKNQEHVAKLHQLDREFKGDRTKVNAALSREFIP